MLTTQKISTGEFESFWNGEKTPYRIINGSLGLSGRDTRNMYGITGYGNVSWIGSLAAAKKTLAFWMKKEPGAFRGSGIGGGRNG